MSFFKAWEELHLLAFHSFYVPPAQAQEGRQSYIATHLVWASLCDPNSEALLTEVVFRLTDTSKMSLDRVESISEWQVGHLLKRISRTHNLALANTFSILSPNVPLHVPYSAVNSCLCPTNTSCVFTSLGFCLQFFTIECQLPQFFS